MAGQQKSSKAGRKRKKGVNLRYRNENRHEKSHVRRITKHLSRFPDDKVAVAELRRYQIGAGIVSAKPA